MTPSHFRYLMSLMWLMCALGAAAHPHRGERLKRRTRALVEFDRRLTRPTNFEGQPT